MHRADAQANFSRHLADALCQLASCTLDLVGLGTRPAKPPPHLASLGDEFPIAIQLHLDDAQAGPDPMADYRAFEFGKAPVSWNLPAGVVVSIDC